MIDKAKEMEVVKRLMDYQNNNPTEEHRKLVEFWRKYHPEAAKETSSYLKPLIRHWHRTNPRTANPDQPKEPDEAWFNDTYYVAVRRWDKDPVFGSSGGMIQLGISSFDGSARHDWRDFQAIKNQLAGPECEAFELYPAESRLLDPSIYYTLWCFPGVKKLKIGCDYRDVRPAELSLAPQRAFPDEQSK